MSARWRIPLLFWIVCAGVFLFIKPVEASKPLAKLTSFKGEVIILSDIQVTRVSKTGLLLNEGDKIQTKDGQAEVTFDDGSLMKLSPFTSAMIQEREEESGWLFKTKTTARRLTVFVGKLWFKSGASNKKNILQTPTAVCGLRGSESEVGFDNIRSFLNIITGGSDTIGNFVMGQFESFGLQTAMQNPVFQKLVDAYTAYTAAVQSGAALDKAKAELDALLAAKEAADALMKSPDESVRNQANAISNTLNGLIKDKKAEIDQIPTTTGGTTTTTTTSVLGESTTSTTRSNPLESLTPSDNTSTTTTTRASEASTSD